MSPSDPREIWVDGERITDVVSHPKLRGAALAYRGALHQSSIAVEFGPSALSGCPLMTLPGYAGSPMPRAAVRKLVASSPPS